MGQSDSTTSGEWPPRFTVNPEGIAALFLLRVDADAGRDEQKNLAEIFRAYFRGGQQNPDADSAEEAHRRRSFLGDEESYETYDLVSHLHRQREFSLETFGPGERVNGVLDHIKKERKEIEKDPSNLEEWIDVVLLALDGAYRQGYSPSEVAAALDEKLTENENRDWPDWREQDRDTAIEHIE